MHISAREPDICPAMTMGRIGIGLWHVAGRAAGAMAC